MSESSKDDSSERPHDAAETPAPPERPVGEDLERACPECGGTIRVDDVICPHCGVPLVGG